MTLTLRRCENRPETVLNLKSIRRPWRWDFMGVWLSSAPLPWGASWIRWTRRPVNPLIELSLPEEETMKGVSGWLQKYGRGSRVSRSQLILTQSRRRLIPASSRRAGTGAIQSQLSGALPFILPPRQGRARLHMASSKFPRFWSLRFPVEIVKIKQLDDSAGGPASISWLRCLVSSSPLKRISVLPVFTQGRTNPTYFCPYFCCIRASGGELGAENKTLKSRNEPVKFIRWFMWMTGYWF